MSYANNLEILERFAALLDVFLLNNIKYCTMYLANVWSFLVLKTTTQP